MYFLIKFDYSKSKGFAYYRNRCSIYIISIILLFFIYHIILSDIIELYNTLEVQGRHLRVGRMCDDTTNLKVAFQ